jgi:hypothetical protein
MESQARGFSNLSGAHPLDLSDASTQRPQPSDPHRSSIAVRDQDLALRCDRVGDRGPLLGCDIVRVRAPCEQLVVEGPAKPSNIRVIWPALLEFELHRDKLT